ncbi:hypothetical protein AB0I25_29690 [Nocardia tengchongensis]|uniref:hypothetical protein n=1 Tax=Nocardia tengchongensis TaxID=2055889 RepID=UPI0033DF659C
MLLLERTEIPLQALHLIEQFLGVVFPFVAFFDQLGHPDGVGLRVVGSWFAVVDGTTSCRGLR